MVPIFEELGEKLVDEDVDLVKIDGVLNDLPDAYAAPVFILFMIGYRNTKLNNHLKIFQGYPTIFWVPSDTKIPEMANGDREEFRFFDQEDNYFLKFVSERAVKELNKYDRSGKQKVIHREL